MPVKNLIILSWFSRSTSMIMAWGWVLNLSDQGSGSRTIVDKMLLFGLANDSSKVSMNLFEKLCIRPISSITKIPWLSLRPFLISFTTKLSIDSRFT